MAQEGEIVANGEGLPLTPAERLTQQFYAWERRGRGWQLWDFAVELEPPFQPFLGHYLPSGRAYDDGRRPTRLSALIEKLRGRLGDRAHEGEGQAYFPEIDYSVAEPAPSSAPSRLVEFQTSVPLEVKIPRESAEQLLLSLTYCKRPVALELIGTSRAITLQFVSAEADHLQIR